LCSLRAKPTSTDTPPSRKRSPVCKYRYFCSVPCRLRSAQTWTAKIDLQVPTTMLWRGQSTLHDDWKLAFPEVDLLWYNCNNLPTHADTSSTTGQFSKKLSPIWTHAGLPTWCGSNELQVWDLSDYAANDGRLLSILPADVTAAYPVLPGTPQARPQKDLSDDVELLMKPTPTGFIGNHSRNLAWNAGRWNLPLSFPTIVHIPVQGIHFWCLHKHSSIAAFQDHRENNTLPYIVLIGAERNAESWAVSETEKLTWLDVSNHKITAWLEAVFTGNKGSTEGEEIIHTS
jgi:hypothetical protein